jgi:hypothetical protein
MTLYLILMYLAALALGYVVRFTQATLALGRSLSDAGTPRGYQDAITPPRFSIFALAIYALCLGGIIYGFWQFGWLSGAGISAGFLVALVINGALLLPRKGSEHFRRLIIGSMIRRHADYLKSGDALRATVMAMLLEKLGIPVNEFIERLKK